jgi:plastocyanin
MKRHFCLTAFLVALSACGGAASSTPDATLPAEAFVITAVSGLRFDAESYGPVSVGSTMLGYKNEDSIRHTLILAKDGVKVPNFKLEIGQKGDVDSGEVDLEVGTYELICDVPGHANMKATLTVQ